MSSESDHYLDEKLQAHDPDFLLTRIFVDREDRLFLSALHALRVELRTIPGSIRDPGVALNKLHWWQQEWQRLTEQQARHPVNRVLQQHLQGPPPPIEDATLALARVCAGEASLQSIPELLEFSDPLVALFADLEADGMSIDKTKTDIHRCWLDIELLATAGELRVLSLQAANGSAGLFSTEQQPTGQELQRLIEQSLQRANQDYPGCGGCHAHIYRQVQLARVSWLGQNPGVPGKLAALGRLRAAWRGARSSRQVAR